MLKMTNIQDELSSYNDYQVMIEHMGQVTAEIYKKLLILADEEGYDRNETVEMFYEMFEAVLEEIDADEFEVNNYSHLN